MNKKTFYIMFILTVIGGLVFYYEVSGSLYYLMAVFFVLLVQVLPIVYSKMLPVEESVRIPLNVVHIDNQIDLWRGRLCTAQHEDDVENEEIALIHIDVYQDLRVSHGLSPLPRVS